MRDNPDRETFLQQLGDGKADPVDRDRPFVSGVVGEVRRQIDFKAIIFAASVE